MVFAWSPEVEEEPATGYKHVMYHGVPYAPRTVRDRVDALRAEGTGFVPGPDDVLLITYPKCGTTWVQQILLLLLAEVGDDGEDADADDDDPIRRAPWIDADACMDGELHARLLRHGKGGEGGQGGGRRAVFKTHAPCQLAPWDASSVGGVPPANGAKCVVVSRNPLDACVSTYHHAIDKGHVGSDVGFGPFLDLFLNGKVHCGDYWEWHRGWWDATRGGRSSDDDVLWVWYEDLCADPEGQVRRLAAFAGMAVDDGAIRRTVESTSFGTMKERFDREDMTRRFGRNHVRKGGVGGWRDPAYEALASRRDEFARRSRGMPEGFWACEAARKEACGIDD